MKVKTIFRGAAAALLSVSLVFSGMSVTAAGLDGAASKQQVETMEEAGNPTGSEAAPEEHTDGNTEHAPEEAGKLQDVNDGTDVGSGAESSEGADAGNGAQDNSGADTEMDEPNHADTGTDGQNHTSAEEESETEESSNIDTESEEEKDSKAKEDDEIETDSKAKEASESEREENVTKEEENKIEALFSHNMVGGNIIIDGDLSDWAGVTARACSGADSWKAVFSSDGNTLYFNYTGTASTQWDYGFASNSMSFQFTYPDGAAGADSGISVNAWDGGAVVKDAAWGDVLGAEASVTNEANGNNLGPYTVELAVPVSFFRSMDFTVTFGGTSVHAGDIEQVDGNSMIEELPAVYNGITIDGDYSDWKAVAKTDVSCPNPEHTECLSQVAAVYDGDWFYIYVKDGKGSNASGAGTHSNGKFAITSDLGYETDIQFSTAPAIGGVNGAQVSYVGSQWEVAIPKEQLPKYQESLSFGLYLGEPFLTGIVNLQPDSGNNLENIFQGVSYDGSYEDWEDYGHSTIEYATAGSQESQVDAKGALYSSGERIYGHVVTSMPQHLQEAGGEFTSAVTIAFNQSTESLKNGTYDQKMAFYPRYVTVDADGAVNWNPKLSGLSEGTYEYYIASADAWHTSTNIGNLNDMDQLYGKMMMTIGKDGKDEMEFYLELPMIAGKLGVDKTALKEISAQFGRIGQQWLYTAGTSTGPIAGVVICIVSVGAVLLYQKRKKNKLLPVAA